MKISDLKDTCEMLVGNFKSYAKLSADEVDHLEKEIGYKFPDDYREFLMTYGCVQSGSEEIFGYGGPKHLSFFEKRNRFVLDSILNFPENLIPIRGDGFGNYDCLQLSANTANVVWWVHDGNGYIHEIIALSFSVWLDEVCEQAQL